MKKKVSKKEIQLEDGITALKEKLQVKELEYARIAKENARRVALVNKLSARVGTLEVEANRLVKRVEDERENRLQDLLAIIRWTVAPETAVMAEKPIVTNIDVTRNHHA